MTYWLQTPDMAVAIPALIGAALAHRFPERVEYDEDANIIWINALDGDQ